MFMFIFAQIAIYLLLFFQVIILLFLLAICSVLFSAIISVPWVPTRHKNAKRMFEMAELKAGQTVVDFGCGDGALLITAVQEFGASKGIGYENQFFVRMLGKMRIKFLGLSHQIEIRKDNFLKLTEFPQADLIATYLFAEVQAKLEPALKVHYPKGTKVIARTFRYPTLELLEEKQFEDKEKFFLYKI